MKRSKEIIFTALIVTGLLSGLVFFFGNGVSLPEAAAEKAVTQEGSAPSQELVPCDNAGNPVAPACESAGCNGSCAGCSGCSGCGALQE